MKEIVLNNLYGIEFAKELKKQVLENKDKKNLNFEITNALAKNFEILGYYMIKKKISKINLKLNKEIDIILKRKLHYHLKQFFIYYSKHFTFEFIDLLDDEILIILGMKNYLHYCDKLDKKPKWNENFLKKELKEINKQKHLTKYETFNDCINLLKKFPYSKFNFPTEKGKDRFVLYFYMYSEKQKKELFSFLEKHNIKYDLLLDLIKNNKINEEIYYYAFGFSYVDNKLIRFTLYTKFDIELLKANKLNDFIFKKHKFKLDYNFENIWFYGIDFFPNQKLEFKFYDEPYFFKEKLNGEISSILRNKKCVKVSKYKNGLLSNIKYEFEIQKNFNSYEQKILSENGLYEKKSKLLAIYLSEGEIIHKVFYNL